MLRCFMLRSSLIKRYGLALCSIMAATTFFRLDTDSGIEDCARSVESGWVTLVPFGVLAVEGFTLPVSAEKDFISR